MSVCIVMETQDLMHARLYYGGREGDRRDQSSFVSVVSSPYQTWSRKCLCGDLNQSNNHKSSHLTDHLSIGVLTRAFGRDLIDTIPVAIGVGLTATHLPLAITGDDLVGLGTVALSPGLPGDSVPITVVTGERVPKAKVDQSHGSSIRVGSTSTNQSRDPSTT